MKRFEIIDTPIQDLKIISRQRLGDSRGFISRLFCFDELRDAGYSAPIAQINHSFSQHRGTVRGMHFQYPPRAEIKLVSCIKGAVWDVAVDIRQNSSTFLHWYAYELSVDNNCAFLIPEGFAHGFQVLSEGAELIYLHSDIYVPEAEGGLNPNDPMLAIDWPLKITEKSQRDSERPHLDTNFKGLLL